MLLLIFAALLGQEQTDAEQIRRLAQAYAKDSDPAAKTALLKVGKRAIRAVYEARAPLKDEAFDALTELLFSLRFKEDKEPRSLALRDRLATRTLDYTRNKGMEPQLLESILWGMVSTWSANKTVVVAAPTFDPQCAAIRAQKLDTTGMSGPAYVLLDRILAPHGLDWGYRYGRLFISTPARLWPRPGPSRASTDEETTRLRALIADLDATELDARERASRDVLEFREAAIPMLKQAKGSGELASRVADLVSKLEAKYGDLVWETTCAMDRQALEGADRKVAEQVNGSLLSVEQAAAQEARFAHVRLDAVLGFLGRSTGVPIECPDLLLDMKVDLQADGISLRDALLTLRAAYALDFYVQDGKVRIDTRANAEQRVK